MAWRIGSHHFPQYNKTPQQNWIQLQYQFAGGPTLWVHSVNFTQESGLVFGELTSGICPSIFKEKILEAIGNRISRWPNMLQWLSAVGGFYIRKNWTPVSNVSKICPCWISGLGTSWKIFWLIRYFQTLSLFIIYAYIHPAVLLRGFSRSLGVVKVTLKASLSLR